MGVRTIRGADQSVMYCSVTDWAFGPVFSDTKDHDAEDRIEAFLRWLPLDPRKYRDYELESKYSEWLAQEEAQWKAEEETEKVEDE